MLSRTIVYYYTRKHGSYQSRQNAVADEKLTPKSKDQSPVYPLYRTSSSQKVQHGPAEKKEDHHAAPENPLVLARASFHHSDGVAAYSQSVGDTVQPALSALEDLALLAEVCQYCAAPIQKVIKLIVGIGEE